MAKKKKAAKKKDKRQGEQLPLIDVEPENLKEILAEVKIYKRHQKDRLSALKKESTSKQRVHELVTAADLKPLEDGIIRFICDGKEITIEPRDEVIRIKEAKKPVRVEKKDEGTQ